MFRFFFIALLSFVLMSWNPSNMASVQLTPRVMAAYERLEKAVRRLHDAVEAQPAPQDPQALEELRSRVSSLEQENAELNDTLSKASSEEMQELETLRARCSELEAERDTLQKQASEMKETQDHVATRLEKLIGDVDFVLSEPDGEV